MAMRQDSKINRKTDIQGKKIQGQARKYKGYNMRKTHENNVPCRNEYKQ